jgi:hypothetical protein
LQNNDGRSVFRDADRKLPKQLNARERDLFLVQLAHEGGDFSFSISMKPPDTSVTVSAVPAALLTGSVARVKAAPPAKEAHAI